MEEHDDDCDGGEWMSDGWWVVAVSSDIRPMSVTEWYFVFSPKFESQKDEWEVCSVLPDKVFVFSWAILLLLSVSSSLNPSPREQNPLSVSFTVCSLYSRRYDHLLHWWWPLIAKAEASLLGALFSWSIHHYHHHHHFRLQIASDIRHWSSNTWCKEDKRGLFFFFLCLSSV